MDQFAILKKWGQFAVFKNLYGPIWKI